MARASIRPAQATRHTSRKTGGERGNARREPLAETETALCHTQRISIRLALYQQLAEVEGYFCFLSRSVY
jgi:hypothetical protein